MIVIIRRSGESVQLDASEEKKQQMAGLNGTRVSVILPASGSGERFGSKTPKQFCKVIDVPIILHTISLFHSCSWISEIVVTVSPAFLQYTLDLVTFQGLSKVSVIEGCQCRHRSIFAGVKHLNGSNKPQVVIIHDGVRVFAEENLIRDVALAALEHGASGVVRPLVSTVVSADSEGFLQESLDRNMYRASEMPQAFLYHVINTAYEKSTDFDFDYGTECLLLAKKYTGTRAKLIDGPDYLWKVTLRKDLFSAEGLKKEELLQVLLHDETCTDLNSALIARCTQQRMKVQITSEVEDSKLQMCNSHVFTYRQFDTDSMTDNTESVCGRQTAKSDLKLATSVVHVYLVPELGAQDTLGCLNTCRQLAEHHGKALVYTVICEGSPDITKVSDMVVDILWNRTKSMSGQTFFIR